MTNALKGATSLASTPALYCGAPLYGASVPLDMIEWLARAFGVVGTTKAKRRIACMTRVMHAPLAEILLGLYDAALAGSFDDARLAQQLATAQSEIERIVDLPAERNDIIGRLAMYRLELRDPTVLQPARMIVCDNVSHGDPGDEDLLLVTGLCLTSENSPLWTTAPIGVRQAMIDLARHDLRSVLKIPEPVDEPQATRRALMSADIGLDEEERRDLLEDRPGIVRTMRKVHEAGRIVLASVDHLPGIAKGGESRLGTSVGSTARSEWAPMAGIRLKLIKADDVVGVAAKLRAEFPYASSVIETMLMDLVASPFARVRPTLLLGPPGCGKTRLARRICELLGLHVTVYACAGVSDAAFGGTSRQWGTGRACIPLQAVRRAWRANPVIVLDEIEKGATDTRYGRLDQVLIPFLEPESSRRHFDPYVETDVDLSCVSYLATANGLGGISDPLLDRMRVLRVPEPRAEDLPVVAASIVAEIRQEREIDAMWLPDLTGEEIALIGKHWQGGSLRLVRRLAEAVLASRESLAARH